MTSSARSALAAFVILIASLHPACAQTRPVPPPGSPNKNAATRNIQDVIKTLRNSGFKREASQLYSLLIQGRVHYHATGDDVGNAKFVHSLQPGDPGRLIFARKHVNDPDGKGAQRYSKDDNRPMYSAVLTTLHELTHKDQGQATIIKSENLAPIRGYTLHEIEAYRISLKKYATPYVIDPIKAYLAKRGGMTDAQREAALDALRGKLYPLAESLNYLGYEGANDRVCRWVAIKKQMLKLRDGMLALVLDLKSRRLCSNHLKSADPHKQSAIETELRRRALRNRIAILDTRIALAAKRYRADQRVREELARRLRRSRNQEQRLKLAARIGRYDVRLRGYREQLADDRPKRRRLRAELKRLVQKNKKAQQIYGSAAAKFDQCRLAKINKVMKGAKLTTSQLPPDMVVSPNGGAAFVKPGKRRTIDLASAVDALKDRFNYPGKLNWKDAKGNQRTPCYKPPPPPPPTPAKANKKCPPRRGGLTGHMSGIAKCIGQ